MVEPPGSMKSMLRLLLLLPVMVGRAHTVDPKVASFLITGESRDTISVSLPKRRAKCTFDYVAGQPVHEKKQVKEGSQIKVEDVVHRLSGQCASGQSGYWTYEVCIEGTIRQYHGADSYMLGRFNRVEGKTLKFDNGLPCDPPSNPMLRKVDVSLACSDNMGLQLISEPSTCVYTMTLLTPEVCADSSFPKLMSSPGGAGGPKPDDGHEDWVLQVREMESGEVVCTAFSTEQKLAGSRLSFSFFSLNLQADEDGERKVANPTMKARAMGRVPLSSSEVSTARSMISHGKDFNGKLGYVEVAGMISTSGGDGAAEAAASSTGSAARGGWFT